MGDWARFLDSQIDVLSGEVDHADTFGCARNLACSTDLPGKTVETDTLDLVCLINY